MKYTCLVAPGESGTHVLFVVVPDAIWPSQRVMLDKSAEKHSGYLTLDVSLPHRPRTTGEKSQNNKAWGAATQIARGLNQGDDPRDVLYDACIATAGYPTRMNKFGRIVAQSWS